MTSARIIDGKDAAARLKEGVAAAVAALKAKHGLVPGLATVLVGDDPASQVYVRNKQKTAHALGMNSVQHDLPADTREADLLDLVRSLNADKAVNGILVQLPVPNMRVWRSGLRPVPTPLRNVVTPSTASMSRRHFGSPA